MNRTVRAGESAEPAAKRRFFVSEPPAGDALLLHGDLAHRITSVLRMRPGDTAELFDGSGRSWSAMLTAVDRRSVRLALGEARSQPPGPRTTVLAALIRPTRFESLLEKATELGASALVPLVTRHSAVRPAEVRGERLARWRRILVEAAEQCGRMTVPELTAPLPLADALAARHGRLIVAAEPALGAAPPIGAVLTGIGDAPCAILIGPEGGLSPAELRAITEAGGEPVSLGPLVLRAETAAIAALAVLADARGR